MFSNGLIDVAVVLVVLGSMVLIHELGHFLAAKYFGVRVLTFSVGFGPRLFGVKRGGTDYRLSALPLGGYVKMAGDDPTQAREGDSGEFLSKPRWQRFVIVVMGPTMNALLAVALLTGLYRYHYEKPAYMDEPARVGEVEPNSPAAMAGVLPGDQIDRLDTLSNPKWDAVGLKILTTVNEALPLVVLRDGKELSLSVTPRAEGPDAVGYAGWTPYIPALIKAVQPGLPAAQAGLKPGDEVLELNGKRALFTTAAQLIQTSNGKPVDFKIQRDGKTLNIPITPVYNDTGGEKKWRVGVEFQPPVVVRHLPWVEALITSVEFNAQSSTLTFDVLGKILTRRMSARSLSGPIGIAQLSGQAYRQGIAELIPLVSMISMQLAIFNFLPIPVLDGGVILLLVIEGAIRHDLSLKVKERFVQVGLAILLLLVVVVTYFDLVKTFRPS